MPVSLAVMMLGDKAMDRPMMADGSMTLARLCGCEFLMMANGFCDCMR